MTAASILLKNAHVIDPDQGIDGVRDVLVSDGKIEAVGPALAKPRGVEELDLKGSYLTPGWIDIHVHTYGALGFSDVDSIGVYQGVTSMVDAGDAGVRSLDEFAALIYDRNETSVYAGPHIQPLGILGFEEGGRKLNNIDVERWLDWKAQYPDMMRYLKVSAYSLPTAGPLYLAKGMAEILDLPLYQHLGEMQAEPLTPSMLEYAFEVAGPGDIITHIYHNNPGKVLGADGKVLPFVRAAHERGVLFDIGFGSMNFAWKIAESCIQQDLVTDIISSDLQQFNIVYPAHSLSNVMSLFFVMGLSLQQIIERVTVNPAKALKLTDRAGSLRVGQVADITVFELQTGEFELFDCYKRSRKSDRKIVPAMAFKAGKRFDCDLLRGEQENNWFMQVADEHVPANAANLSAAQKRFLANLTIGFSEIEWVGYTENLLNINDAYQIQDVFHRVLKASGLPLRDGLKAVFDCFLEQPFTVQVGLFLVRLERPFVLERLKAVSAREVEFA
jgi:dihydroorotase